MSDDGEDWWMGGQEATVWCHDGHAPKLLEHVEGDDYRCRVDGCGNRFTVSVDVDAERDAEGGGVGAE